MRAIHGLEEEALELPALEGGGIDARLGIDQLELLSGVLDHRDLALGADADPVDAGRAGEGAVGFQGDAEAPGVQGVDEGDIHLQQRLPAGQHHEPAVSPAPPGRRDGFGQVSGGREAPAARAVQAHEVRVAEIAGGGRAVVFPAGPEIAAREPAEHRRPAGLAAFALQGEEDLLDGVAHADRAGRPAASHSRQPRARRSQAGQAPQPCPQAWRSPRSPT